jgi:hypothetical protein
VRETVEARTPDFKAKLTSMNFRENPSRIASLPGLSHIIRDADFHTMH